MGKFVKSLSKTNFETKAIGLFGGSFDPIHNGHLELAQKALEQFNLDQIVFIPTFQSPFKIANHSFSPQQRIDLLKLALQEKEKFSFSDIEVNAGDISYSYKTIAVIRDEFPTTKLYWLLGSDNWPKLHNWNNFPYLKDELEFLIFKRDDLIISDNPYDVKYSFIEDFDYRLSSTEIRKKIQDNDLQGLENFLPSQVFQYISSSISLFR